MINGGCGIIIKDKLVCPHCQKLAIVLIPISNTISIKKGKYEF
jgi:hypothetical protein